VAILEAVIVCTFVWAISYRPLTSEEPVAHHYDSTAAAENNPSNQDQRGTRSVPLIVETVDPPEGAPERERLEKERQEKAANERGLTVATWVGFGRRWLLRGSFATAIVAIAVALGAPSPDRWVQLFQDARQVLFAWIPPG
jgi:hypothetical protein